MLFPANETLQALMDVQKQFFITQFDMSANGGMPKPRGVVCLKSSFQTAATVELFEGSLRYYPLSLEGVRMGDKLRAHYGCYLPGKGMPRVDVRYDAEELMREERFLSLLRHDAVHRGTVEEWNIVEWNMLQVRAGRLFTALPHDRNRGVRPDIIDAFHDTPPVFEAALAHWYPKLIAQ